jgi:hypothetical protein
MVSISAEDYDRAFERLLAELSSACEARAQWPARVIAATDTALRFLAEDPLLAEILTADVFLIGPAGLTLHHNSVRRLAEMLAQGRRYSPRAKTLPACTERVLVGGIFDFLSDYILAHGTYTLPALGPELAQLALTPYLGVEEAAEAVEAESRWQA